MEEVEGRGKTT